MVTSMAAVSLTQQQCRLLIDRISGLEARMATLQTHAEAQQEQIRVAEIVIQQLRTNPTNPSPPFRAAFQKQVTEGGDFKALTKCTGNHPDYHDARRVLQERTRDLLLQWISVQISEVHEKDVLEYRRTTDLSSTDMYWLNSEMYTLLAIKTSDTAMASIKSLEKWKSRELLANNAWNVKREDTINIEWRFSPNRWLIQKEC